MMTSIVRSMGDPAVSSSDPSLPCGGSRRGFTLIEVLVSIGIVALLAAVFLPAMNMVRESSRQRSCESNIRQLGIAMLAAEQTAKIVPHNGGVPDFDDKHQDGLPMGSVITSRDGNPVHVEVTLAPGFRWPLGVGDPKLSPQDQTGCWAYTTLPHIGETNAFQKVDFKKPQPLHLCPSRGRRQLAVPVDDLFISHSAGGWEWAKTDYAATNNIGSKHQGGHPLSYFAARGLDGMALIGEKAMAHGIQLPTNWYRDEPLFTGGSKSGTTRFKQQLLRDVWTEDASEDLHSSFGSAHSGGVNFVFFSGRTQLVAYETDREVLRQMIPDFVLDP